jgi:uncharacterized protein involved in type VI secretion and phage assembly
MNDALLQELLERVRGRFYGKYRGVVADVDAATMRIKASVPAVLPQVPTGWCVACVPYAGPSAGVVMLPEIGSGVWIEFEGGDVSYPIWTGCLWRAGEVPSQASATVKAVYTAAGSIAFDNNAGNVTVMDKQQNTLVLDSNGVTGTSGSSTVAIGSSGVNVNNGALEVN